MKVIRSLGNRGFSIKETIRKLLVKKEDFSIFLSHNLSWFTINEQIDVLKIYSYY